MLEKPKRPVKPNIQDRLQPTTVEELIRKYDLENKGVYDFLDKIVDYINKNFESEQKEIMISEVLWENPNPSSAMNTKIINLSSDDYDYLQWFHVYSNSDANLKTQMSVSCPKGCNIILMSIGYSTGVSVRRTIDYINDTTYSARIGRRDNEDNGNYAIPVKVVGYKKLIKI